MLIPQKKNKKILVTGGAGYIGSVISYQLIQQGYEVLVFDNLTTGFRDALAKECQFLQGDIRSESDLKVLFSNHTIDAIIHMAARVSVPESLAKPLEYYENNFIGSLRLFEQAIKYNVNKVIFSSTAAVYSPPQTAEPLPESAVLGPLSPYGETKLQTEKLLSSLNKAHQMQFIALRYFNVAGATLNNMYGQRTKNATHLVKVVAEAAANKRDYIEVYGTDYLTHDGSALRDFIHVEDLAQAHILALEKLFLSSDQNVSSIYNCGYSLGFSVLDVIKTFETLTQAPLKVRLSPRRAGDLPFIVADSSLIQKELGWTPQHKSLEIICQTAYLWEKSQPSFV